MSTNDAIIQEYTAAFIHESLEVALIGLYLYDYLLCFSREIELMWLGKFRLSTILYFSVRYLPAAKIVFVLMAPNELSSCTALYRFVEILGVIARAGIIATLIGRTYAVWNRNKIILAVLGSLGIGVVVLGVIEVFYTECVPPPRRFQSSAKWGTILSSTRLVLEATAVILSLVHSFSDFRMQRSRLLFTQSFSAFILRNGLMYFIAAVVLEFLAIIFNIDGLVPTSLNNVTNALPLPIPAILISRFLLELRSMATHNIHTTYASSISMSFADVNRGMSDDFGGTTMGYDELHDAYPMAEPGVAANFNSTRPRSNGYDNNSDKR